MLSITILILCVDALEQGAFPVGSVAVVIYMILAFRPEPENSVYPNHGWRATLAFKPQGFIIRVKWTQYIPAPAR